MPLAIVLFQRNVWVLITVVCKTTQGDKMASREKKTIQRYKNSVKQTVQNANSSNGKKAIWLFDELDKDGDFAFDILREDFQHKEFLDKMISYTNMTWNQILAQTHDQGKSKHHFLKESGLSRVAKERICALDLEQDTDRIFSFALQNKLRIIGLRENELFHVKWYDPKHECYPSHKK